MKRLAIVLIFGLTTTAAWAAPSRYVSDDLVISLRTGQGTQYRIIEQLHSGSRLEILEEGGEYVRVRSPKGREGWVRAQYLSNEPVARQKLAAAQKKLNSIGEENRSLQGKLQEVGAENGELKTNLDRVTKEKAQVEAELEKLREVAARPAELNEQNQRMKGRIAELEAEAKRLEKANTALKDGSQREWFITGAGVLGGGILLGLVLPLLRRRKSSGFDLR